MTVLSASKKLGPGVAAFLFIATSALALDEQAATDKAMRALKKGDRDTAARMMEKALGDQPGSAFLNYHAGLVYYDSGDYAKAKECFTKALALREKKQEARANYNAGNSLFRSAKEAHPTDPEQAVELLKEALNYYGRAIELNNADKDASYNYELTKKVIKVIKEQIPPPMSKPKSGGDSKEEKEQDKQQQRQEEQQKKDQQEESQEEKQQEEQKNQQQQQQQQQQEQQQQKEPSGGQPKPEGSKEEPREGQAQAPHKEGLSEEEARMLVATYGQEGPRLDINKDQQARNAKVLKNW